MSNFTYEMQIHSNQSFYKKYFFIYQMKIFANEIEIYTHLQ